MKKKPLVSLANLVEFAASPSAARRRSIIEQYHQPNLVKFDWHGASDVIFAQRACGSSEADSLIDFEKDRISKELSGEKEKDRRLRHVLQLVDLLEASDLVRLTNGTAPSIANNLSIDCNLDGLIVRVRPNLVLSRQRLGYRDPEFGVLKCHNLSTFKLEQKTGELFAVGLQLFAENAIGSNRIAYDLCRVYDLYGDQSYAAPKNQKRLRSQLYDAAQEILDRWDPVGKRVADKHATRRKAS